MTVVVADQRAQQVHLLDVEQGRWSTIARDTALAEHAGMLPLPDGRLVFADDASGELVVLGPRTAASGHCPVQRVPIAIPAEHLAAGPRGRHLVVTTGAGASLDPAGDQLTVVDLGAPGRPRARRVRTRAGEPGVAVTEREVFLRHRVPGAVEVIDIAAIMAAGPHVPSVVGAVTDDIGDAGHGDAYDPVSHTFMVATERGLERFALVQGRPVPAGVAPWGISGARAYYLRCCPRRRVVVATLRADDESPRQWHRWGNHVWTYDLDSGVTRVAPVGDGLVFRCALTSTALVTTRVHPDGDELVVHDLATLTHRGRWSLPPMARGPRPGREPWDDADRRAVAASPSAETVVVTRGGHGQVHVVDVGCAETPVRTFEAPSPLRDGGHLGWWDAPFPDGLDDRIGR